MSHNNDKTGILLVLSGPSGVGKDTICAEYIKNHPDVYISVSVTDRKPRGDEVDGIHYNFVNQQEFKRMVAENELLEYAEYVNHSYGTPAKPIVINLQKGHDCILIIETVGGLKVKQAYPQSVLVFVYPPSIEVLRQRLSGRGTETERDIDRRMGKAMLEFESMRWYDYLIENNTAEQAARNLETIFAAAKCSTQNILPNVKRRLNL